MQLSDTNSLQTREGLLVIKQVGIDELDRVIALMRQASAWLRSRGILQWRWVYTEDGCAQVAARFATDDVYLVFMDDEPVATFSLRWQETELWGERGFDGQAGYLHGLAVDREIGGVGIGKVLMEWIASQIASRGRRYFRLDTAAYNPGLCGYYAREGFRPCGVTPHPQCQMSQLYEKELCI